MGKIYVNPQTDVRYVQIMLASPNNENIFKLWTKLNGGTVPPFNLHHGGTVPPFNLHRGGTLPNFEIFLSPMWPQLVRPLK